MDFYLDSLDREEVTGFFERQVSDLLVLCTSEVGSYRFGFNSVLCMYCGICRVVENFFWRAV